MPFLFFWPATFINREFSVKMTDLNLIPERTLLKIFHRETTGYQMESTHVLSYLTTSLRHPHPSRREKEEER